ncbi:hypothetical protein HBA43_21020 [Providencia rettgeri]|uniref:hypothetical protein n=1 Tax=Providencia rettgeri TaxID=587 RepID=UPI00141A3CBA|nr:hypothetical protein [Providencia rettgeri]NIA76624.1 hypothetical protein [Providencia rettgeri]NIA80864.1 hypothetical protein [Providencia rettgeri]NIB04099.1 hypothetical protein [Providencia rettgeri]NIB08301.1 hypothetical protein [Providencia rettgeri]NIB21911.1 hypothetical protein [Providencia rettgeri]
MHYPYYILGLFLLISSFIAPSATIDLIAKIEPSINNDTVVFTNMTPQEGYCVTLPQQCPSEVSINLPLSTKISYPIKANNEPRQGAYFNFPKTEKIITVRNHSTGEPFDVKFRITNFAARYERNIGQQDWIGGSFVYTPDGKGCGYGGVGYGGSVGYEFMWKTLDNTNPCYKISTIDRDEPALFYQMSIGYSLKAKDSLLTVGSGIYGGKISFSVGPGGDFDFGDNYLASDSIVDINLRLIVNHDLIVKTSPDDRILALEPCKNGKVCTQEQGRNNWERWMVSRITPEMTAKSNFQLSSSGAFTVYLQCEYEIGENCALKSDKNEQLVPIQSYLTLPDNIISQQTNNRVIHAPMSIQKDNSNIFISQHIGSNRNGSIDFLINQRNVDTMLMTRPDTYRGVVTVIFDPNIYGL